MAAADVTPSQTKKNHSRIIRISDTSHKVGGKTQRTNTKYCHGLAAKTITVQMVSIFGRDCRNIWLIFLEIFFRILLTTNKTDETQSGRLTEEQWQKVIKQTETGPAKSTYNCCAAAVIVRTAW